MKTKIEGELLELKKKYDIEKVEEHRINIRKRVMEYNRKYGLLNSNELKLLFDI